MHVRKRLVAGAQSGYSGGMSDATSRAGAASTVEPNLATSPMASPVASPVASPTPSTAPNPANGYLGELIAAGRPDQLFRAYETRDARFDGRFFVGVKTTGIFCRPVCPARTPLRRNVDFYSSAAAAFAAGLRPCLRCRPERAPVLRALAGGEALVARALGAIDAGDLNEGSVEQLSARIGVTSRHLRRLFETHLGATPVQVAQTRRLLFAKQLIEESALPLTDIAFAAGFNSVRRFNTVFRDTYARAPSALRRTQPLAQTKRLTQTRKPAPAQADAPRGHDAMLIRLGTMPSSVFAQLLGFYRTRAFRGVEVVSGVAYARSIAPGGVAGWIELRHDARSDALCLTCAIKQLTQLPRVVARVKRMFDLDAPLAAVQGHLLHDCLLRPALREPVRVPCAWDAFELAVRAVLGQQISVKAASTLSGRLVERYGAPLDTTHSQRGGEDAPVRLFPPPEVLARAHVADICALGIIRARAQTLIGLARHVAATPDWHTRYSGLEAFTAELTALPGIGPWTAHYIAMRGFADPDAFPASDLGLLRSARALGIASTARELERHAERWRPWRAYAAQALWNVKSD